MLGSVDVVAVVITYSLWFYTFIDTIKFIDKSIIQKSTYHFEGIATNPEKRYYFICSISVDILDKNRFFGLENDDVSIAHQNAKNQQCSYQQTTKT